MLGFGKNKKKDTEEKDTSQKGASRKDPPEKKKGKSEPETTPVQDEQKPEKKKKKRISKKLILILVLVLISVGASSFVVYTLYFAPKEPGAQKGIYEKRELVHINLPEEMLKFSFNHFPDLYVSMITFNTEIDLIDKEIARIDAIAKEYPDQVKIAEKEKTVWEKTKATLEKSFLKIEKPVKEIYVLFRVNKEQGLIQVEAKNSELIELARTALTQAQEQTQKLKSTEEIPQGWINGTLYKLKKKFL